MLASLSAWPESLAVADVTGDGRNDVLVTTAGDLEAAPALHVLAQGGDGTLAESQSIETRAQPVAVAAGDLNGDGRADAAWTQQEHNSFGMALQQDGALGARKDTNTGLSPDAIVIGDWNNDLLNDIAVAHAVNQTLTLYWQQPDGSFVAEPYAVAMGEANALAVGDLDSDGRDDLVLLRGGLHDDRPQLAILLQRGSGLANPIWRAVRDEGYTARDVAVGDVSGDGRDDLVVISGGSMPQAWLSVWWQQADGTLADDAVTLPAYHLPEAVSIGDLNHDGHNDVIVAHAGWAQLSVYSGIAQGGLDAYELVMIPYCDSYRPGALALADVTGDGGLDVLIANHSALPEENGVVLLANSLGAPTSTITVPLTGTIISRVAQYTIEGTCSLDEGTLEISTDGGRTWHPQAASHTWNYVWDVPQAGGTFIILSRATDLAGCVQSPPARTRIIVDNRALAGISPESLCLALDEEGWLSLHLTDAEGLQGVDLHLTFDPRYVQVVDSDSAAGTNIEPARTLGPQPVLRNEVNNTTGHIWYRVEVSSGTLLLGSRGLVARVRLRGQADGDTHLRWAQCDIMTSDGQRAPADTLDAYIQVGTGGLATTWQAEAEDGVVMPPLRQAQHFGASGCNYLYSTQQRFDLPVIGSATYTFTVPSEGDYFLWARVSAMSHNHNSFYVSLDGQEDYWYEVEPLGWQWSTWFWDRVYPQDGNPGSFAFSLGAGWHTLRIGVRESHTRLDQLVLSSHSSYVPCSPASTCPYLDLPLVLRNRLTQ